MMSARNGQAGISKEQIIEGMLNNAIENVISVYQLQPSERMIIGRLSSAEVKDVPYCIPVTLYFQDGKYVLIRQDSGSWIAKLQVGQCEEKLSLYPSLNKRDGIIEDYIGRNENPSLELTLDPYKVQKKLNCVGVQATLLPGDLVKKLNETKLYYIFQKDDPKLTDQVTHMLG